MLEPMLVQLAHDFMMLAHDGQKRKYSGEPYHYHPEEVRNILLAAGINDPISQAAALLHDVMEDCGVTSEDLLRHFGPGVELYVRGLTDVSKPEDGNRKARKAKDLQHTSEQCVQVRNIKLADLISNSKNIKYWAQYDKEAAAFWKLYRTEKLAILEVCKDCHPRLLEMAYELVRE